MMRKMVLSHFVRIAIRIVYTNVCFAGAHWMIIRVVKGTISVVLKNE